MTSQSARTPHAIRRNAFPGLVAALVLTLLLVPPASADMVDGGRGPELGFCQTLQVPLGNKVAFHVYAEGVQIWQWTGTTWNLLAPDARLYSDAGRNGLVGTHSQGPVWESTSGSRVWGIKEDGCPMDPTAVPWLRLKAMRTEGTGIFDGVTYILRVNTVGGIAPGYPGSVTGEEVRVPYSAEYYFYRADQ